MGRAGARQVSVRSVEVVDALKAEFAVWYFDWDHVGNQQSWAKEHNVHPTTLSIWKSEPWFQELEGRWKEQLEARFGSVMHAAYKRATNTDDFNNSQIQAARFIADMLGKSPPKKVEVGVNIFNWLEQLAPKELEDGEGK
jgi:hypothetical protein